MNDAPRREDLLRWNQRFSGEDYLRNATECVPREPKGLARPGPASWQLLMARGVTGSGWPNRASDVLSIDFSPIALQKAKALAEERGVNLATHELELSE